jgi:hypothetical protein
LILEKKQFLDLQETNNLELEKKIQVLDRNVSKLRLEQSDESESLRSFQDEVDVLRNTLSKSKWRGVDRQYIDGHAHD